MRTGHDHDNDNDGHSHDKDVVALTSQRLERFI